MRWLSLAALALAACGGSNDRFGDADTRDASGSAPAAAGPDVVALRVARAGGRARAYLYPRLDSAVWASTAAAPALSRVLAFDESAGSLAVVDTRGLAHRVSLRVGSVGVASAARLTALTSADGNAIYGLGGGAVTRVTPSDVRPWTARLGAAPRDVIPQNDGTLLVVADRGAETVVWRVRPPDTAPTDSAVIGRAGRAIASPAGDRVYFVSDSGLVGLRSRTLEPVPAVALGERVRDAVSTPSGDRLFLLGDSSSDVHVVDRYSDEVSTAVTLPGGARELRMDPLGRYLLAQAARGDSAWVVAIGTDRLLGAVRTAWRPDLPVVAPDGMIVTARDRDVVLVDGETLRVRRRVANGARDFWHVLVWNGFRQTAGQLADRRAARAAEPPPVKPADGAAPLSSSAAGALAVDSAARPAPAPGDTSAAPRPPGGPPVAAPPARPAARAGFTVQFAAVRSSAAAQQVAGAVRVSGAPPRIVTTETSGTILYRVVLGPFPTEAEAERAGKASGRDYWVYEGEP